VGFACKYLKDILSAHVTIISGFPGSISAPWAVASGMEVVLLDHPEAHQRVSGISKVFVERLAWHLSTLMSVPQC
jgi:hypothetical protein